MTFMEKIVEKNIPIWDACEATPFIREMKSGELSTEKFRRYIIQDSIYLKNYARVCGKAVYHSVSLKDIQTWYSMLSLVTEEESLVRLSYLEKCMTAGAFIALRRSGSLQRTPTGQAVLFHRLSLRSSQGERACRRRWERRKLT